MREVVTVGESGSLLLMMWNRFWGEEVMVRMATMALRYSTTTAGRLKVVEAGSVVVAGHVGGGDVDEGRERGAAEREARLEV